MRTQDVPLEQESEKDGAFTVTHWSLVLLAGQGDAVGADAALATLCQKYWYPLYFYVRRRGHRPEDAQDLVQGFFARVVEKNYLQAADRTRGRFRSFLLTALNRFIANEWDRAHRLKRGGGRDIVSIDQEDTEVRYLAEPADRMTPERAYEQRWAILLLTRVLDRLDQEFSEARKARIFEELKVFLTGENGEGTYTQIGRRLGMSEGSLKVTVHRMRQRYRELLRAEIGETVDSSEAIDEEIRHLFAALS